MILCLESLFSSFGSVLHTTVSATLCPFGEKTHNHFWLQSAAFSQKRLLGINVLKLWQWFHLRFGLVLF